MKPLTPHAPSRDAIESDLDLDLLDRPLSSLDATARREGVRAG